MKVNVNVWWEFSLKGRSIGAYYRAHLNLKIRQTCPVVAFQEMSGHGSLIPENGNCILGIVSKIDLGEVATSM